MTAGCDRYGDPHHSCPECEKADEGVLVGDEARAAVAEARAQIAGTRDEKEGDER